MRAGRIMTLNLGRTGRAGNGGTVAGVISESPWRASPDRR
jgi:hypothetical protein